MGSTQQQVTTWLEQNHGAFPYATDSFLLDQTPQLVLNLDAFTIDQLEVTVARYRRCAAAGTCRPVAALEALPDDYPVVDVTWYDADAYCRWVGKRLPTEAEWEKAARGADGRWYPWGNEWDDKRANHAIVEKDLKPVGSYPQDASPYGVLDMGGNALEWVADPYSPYPSQPDTTIFSDSDFHSRVERGRQAARSPKTGGPGGSTTNRWHESPNFPRENIIGFRCAQGSEQDWRKQLVRTSLPPTPQPITLDLNQMVYVPAGEFTMGLGASLNNNHPQIGSPAHIVYLDAFYVDRYEVTVAEYVKFLNTLGRNSCSEYPCVYEHQGKVVAQWIDTISGSYQSQAGFENRPVVNVTWWGAQAYCRWRGKRLPTEAEWEKAARGTDGRLYPWGNEWNPTYAAAPGMIFQGGVYPLQVGTHPNDVSPYGAYDMLGNAGEWVADWYSESYYTFSPYANPQGPRSGGDYGHVWRGIPERSEQEGIIIRLFGDTDLFIGFRCTYMP